MKTLTRKISRTAITMALVILAFIAIFRAWVYYTESPWTRDARFSAEVVAIAPDVAGLITAVNVHDNQLVKKDQVLFTIDQPRYQKALEEAEAAVHDMLAGNAFGDAGHRIVIEEFLDGEEASFIVMVDGEHVLPMATSQDQDRKSVV